MAREIIFEEKTITISPELSGETDNVTLMEVVDTGTSIKAKLRVMNIRFEKILWEGAQYQPLADWTPLQIDNKIIEVL
jgi:hypothetical protein